MPRTRFQRLICLLLCVILMLGTAAVAENTANTEYQTLRYEMNNSEAVRRMQVRLNELGYMDVGASGGYYSATVDAVKAFQKQAGLEVNGKVATPEMLALLFSEDAPTEDGGPIKPAPTPTPDVESAVRYGMKDSDAVRQLQRRLDELGYFSSSITGNYFEVTQKAVEAFQKKAGLPVYGKAVDAATMDALFSESAPGADWAPSATATPLPTPTVRPTITRSPDATPRPALYYGDTSEEIREMQQRLIDLKYMSGGATGGYWAATVAAVEAFQKAVNLPVNGRKADTATLEKLFSNDAPVKPGEEDVEPPLTRLYFGLSGSTQVRAMQDRLRDLGYFHDVSTGGYYLKTVIAVANFQAAAGHAVNGYVATVDMLELLYSSDAPKYDPDRPMPTATATPTPAPTATPVPTPEPTEAPYKELKYGMSDSDEVYRMQERLNELGYLSTDPTGGYWSMTVKAVKAFLKDQGMSGDGKTATSEMLVLLYGELPGGDEEEPGEEEPLPYITLIYAMQNSVEVSAMQERLYELGYFDGDATGNYFAMTAEAVAAFQEAAGLPVDGNTATPEMQARLFASDAPTADGGVLPPEEEPEENLPELNTSYRPLSYGMEGSDEVRAMQKKLKERGFFDGSATGGYYSATKKSVAAFQEYCKLPVNGREACAMTLAYLFYEGDLDALIANGGVVPPTEEQPDDGSGEIGFDPEKYAGAKTDTLLSRGDKGEQVDFLIMRLSELGYLEESAPTEYDADVVAAVKWFQNTNLLDSDGIAGPKTLKILYSAEAMSADEGMKDNISSGDPTEVEGEKIEVSIGTVRNIDWFSSEGQAYYDRKSGQMRDGAIIIITDVDSGVSFRGRRSGGYNHADVEPLTAYDTWVMYQIYGGEWSWKRHAIYVTLPSGVSLAGSMNGMPHGSGSISDNNFDGHFCVHFLNSRTHGSDKVDPDHQAAVAKAAR